MVIQSLIRCYFISLRPNSVFMRVRAQANRAAPLHFVFMKLITAGRNLKRKNHIFVDFLNTFRYADNRAQGKPVRLK